MSIAGEGLERKGSVSFGGIRREVNLAFTPEAKPGDYVIVHAGIAISVKGPQAALAVHEVLRGLELDETH